MDQWIGGDLKTMEKAKASCPANLSNGRDILLANQHVKCFGVNLRERRVPYLQWWIHNVVMGLMALVMSSQLCLSNLGC